MTEQRVRGLTIGRLLLDAAASYPDREALVFEDERWSYAELQRRSLSVARALAQLGVDEGDHVGLLMPNCPDFLSALFGIALLGAVAVPINTRFRSRELAHVVQNAELRVLLTCQPQEDHVDYVARLYETFSDLGSASDRMRLGLQDAPRLRTVVLLSEGERAGLLRAQEFAALAESKPAESIAAGGRCGTATQAALILFTSGTTSLPKGCLLSHESVVGTWLCAGDRLGIGGSDRVFDPLPLFHMGGIGPALLCVHRGATMANMRHFEAGAALDLIEREEVSWLYTIFPPITMGLIDHPSFASRDLRSVRAVMNVAPPDTLQVIARAFAPIPSLQGPFGMTEAGGAITCNRLDSSEDERLDTTGPPVVGMKVKVVDPASGKDLPAGQEGELLVRGEGLFDGYYADPTSTAATLDAAGWLRSGDLGKLDEQGRVIYLGRLKEMLKVGGENVAPAEVESLLSTHPAIKLVEVVAAPDARLGEVPAAFVEVVSGKALAASEVIAFCQGKIASFKVPRHVRFMTEAEWPMSATKVQKSRLREMINAELQAGA